MAIDKLKLHVFDFDGTLFKSPMPPPEYWKTVDDWFRDPVSLNAPCVPLKPDDSWWIQDTVRAAEKSIADPNTYAILMTGRHGDQGAMRYRIAELVSEKNLNFDEVHLKTAGGISTDAFKASVISRVLDRYPGIEEAHFLGRSP